MDIENRRSTRVAIHYAFNWQWMAQPDEIKDLWVRIQRSAKSGSTAKVAKAFVEGLVMRSVKHLPRLPRLWAHYSYAGAEHYTRMDHVLLAAHILGAMRQKLDIKAIKNEQCPKYLTLTRMAMEDFSLEEFTGQRKYKAADYCRAMGVEPSNWQASWEPKRLAMWEVMDKLARQALLPVSDFLHGQKEVA